MVWLVKVYRRRRKVKQSIADRARRRSIIIIKRVPRYGRENREKIKELKRKGYKEVIVRFDYWLDTIYILPK